ncbi:Udp-glycosyltransferase 83a1 [Thalictrum thalictroides]|uniref:Udp-glycosyltransferase 83a1 n=1 Tax=Thalictrum thalictroides TaxID=46969 RepID=A0A7J6VEB8_THATH|nr:Udp-glycosyltransferase 83a1 [Thalictrum thalictroides]
MGKPHAIVAPYPVQGHVIPHMELSHRLVKCGFKITFVNTEFNHKRIAATLHNGQEDSQIQMAAISDGLSAAEDRNDIGKLTEAVIRVLPKEVETLIKNINGSDNQDDITCIISDMGWVLELGPKMGIQTAAFSTMGAGPVALMSNIPKLIDTGIINPDGKMIKLKPQSIVKLI